VAAARCAVDRGDPRPGPRPAAARLRPGRAGRRHLPRPRPRPLPRLALPPRDVPRQEGDLQPHPRRPARRRRRPARRHQQPRLAPELRPAGTVPVGGVPLPPSAHRRCHQRHRRPRSRTHRAPEPALPVLGQPPLARPARGKQPTAIRPAHTPSARARVDVGVRPASVHCRARCRPCGRGAGRGAGRAAARSRAGRDERRARRQRPAERRPDSSPSATRQTPEGRRSEGHGTRRR